MRTTTDQTQRELKRPYDHEAGFCFVVHVPDVQSYADTEVEKERSPLVVLEDGKPLDLPHAPHDELRGLGYGRYSHWGEYVRFSSSDRTDPRTNGRRYTIVLSGHHAVGGLAPTRATVPPRMS